MHLVGAMRVVRGVSEGLYRWAKAQLVEWRPDQESGWYRLNDARPAWDRACVAVGYTDFNMENFAKMRGAICQLLVTLYETPE